MRAIFTLPIILLSILFICPSCSKDSQEEMVLTAPTPQTINATVASNATYELNLDKYGTVKIYKQASHFFYSNTGIDSKSGLMVYKYVPAVDYTGDDEVVLSSTKTYATSNNQCNNNSDGNSTGMANMNSTSYITIRIKVIK